MKYDSVDIIGGSIEFALNWTLGWFFPRKFWTVVCEFKDPHFYHSFHFWSKDSADLWYETLQSHCFCVRLVNSRSGITHEHFTAPGGTPWFEPPLTSPDPASQSGGTQHGD